MNKGQVTVFIIVGIVIVVLSSLWIMRYTNDKREIMNSEKNKEIDSEAIKNTLNQYALICLKNYFEDLKYSFGVNKNAEIFYENFLRKNFRFCFDLEGYDDFEVQKGNLYTDVEITENYMRFKIVYPVVLKYDDVVILLDEHIYEINKASSVRIPISSAGIVTTDTTITSADSSMILFIQQGTKISGDSEVITIKMTSSNSALEEQTFDRTQYEISPSGLAFEPPADIYYKHLPEYLSSMTSFNMRLCNKEKCEYIKAELDEEQGLLKGKLSKTI